MIGVRVRDDRSKRGEGVVFFFQAEDGIRDLVRSRGLGDVYKRQPEGRSIVDYALAEGLTGEVGSAADLLRDGAQFVPVSYTHLTLPTIYSV